MTKTLSALLLCMAILCGLPARAQTSSAAIASYNAFVQAMPGGNKVEIYSALDIAYRSNHSLLKSADAYSQDYSLARNNLFKMWPMLENAAIFYSGQGDQAKALYMAEAYVSLPLMDEFRGQDFDYSANRSQLTYFVASRYFNSHDYAKAIPYLELYIMVGDEKNRKNVFMCLVKACKEENEVAKGLNALEGAMRSYPSDIDIVTTGINFCQEKNDDASLQKFLDKALQLRPNDKTFLTIQGKLYEDNREFAKAEAVYRALLIDSPSSLELNKHLAINCYNQGVLFANQSITEADPILKKDLNSMAKQHFTTSLVPLKDVTFADPTSLKYNTALAIAYAQLGMFDELDNVNKKLASLGVGRVAADIIPEMMSFANNNQMAFTQTSPTSGSSLQSKTSKYSADGEVPPFTIFAKDMIESEINQWQAKDPYETASEYQQRVTEKNRDLKVAELKKAAEAEYVKAFARPLNISAFQLKPYDAENGVFLIEGGQLGHLVVPVPRENNEARLFERDWKGVLLENPQYCVVDDHLALASVTFVTPTGKNYQYKSDRNLGYTEVNVDVRFDDIDYAALGGGQHQDVVQKQELKVGASDVDQNIPEGEAGDEKTFVLIIANEDYKAVAKVPFTTNDGNVFAEYCKKTLGLPATNVHVTTNATFIEMRRQIKWLTDVLSAYNGEARAIVYYAGHGIPDEATHSAYLLPVDGDGTDVSTGLSLSNLYQTLASIPSKGVTVMLDACFSGATREGSMLASARGVAIKAKPEAPKGNIVVLSAATGDETAWPYTDESHGLFTYYLLKVLQETNGNATLGEIADYVTREVSRKSIAVNSKSQTPTVSAPEQMGESWKNWTLK